MTPLQCNMVSNYGVWGGSGNPNYKLRSHSLTVLKNGQLRDEVNIEAGKILSIMNVYSKIDFIHDTICLSLCIPNYRLATMHRLGQFARVVGNLI